MGSSGGGGSSGSSSTSGSSTTRVTPTKEERELNKLRLEREKFLDPQLRETQSSGLTLSNLLLTGQNLPGFLSPLGDGFSPEVTADIARESIKDIQPFFQKSGLLDSGVNAEISGRIAGDVRRNTEAFNLNLLTQLLNLGLGGQAQVQQPILGFGALLSQALAGLRTTTTTFNQTTNSSSSGGGGGGFSFKLF